MSFETFRQIAKLYQVYVFLRHLDKLLSYIKYMSFETFRQIAKLYQVYVF